MEIENKDAKELIESTSLENMRGNQNDATSK